MIDLSVPDIRDAKCILCVQPHPDDTDIALGASMAMLAAEGVRIIYLSVTDDAAGLFGSEAALPYPERVKIRREEQLNAARMLGIESVRELGFPDAGDWSVREARKAIVEIIHEVKPDTILTVDPWMRYEAHQDHVKTGFAATEAAILYGFTGAGGGAPDSWKIKAVGLFFTENANTILDVEHWRIKKQEALACHASQWDAESFRDLMAYDSWRGERYGAQLSCKYAEGLMVVPPDWLHIVPDAISLAKKGHFA